MRSSPLLLAGIVLLLAVACEHRLVERVGKPIDVNAPQAVRQCAEHPELAWCHHAQGR